MSTKYSKVKRYCDKGLWNAAMVTNAVAKGRITQTEADEILGVKDETGTSETV